MNEELSATISSQVSKLVDSVRAATVEEVRVALTENNQAVTRAVEKMKEQVNSSGKEMENKVKTIYAKMEETMGLIEKRMSVLAKRVEDQQQRFFMFDGVKTVVFWVAQIAVLIMAVIWLMWLIASALGYKIM